LLTGQLQPKGLKTTISSKACCNLQAIINTKYDITEESIPKSNKRNKLALANDKTDMPADKPADTVSLGEKNTV
jgi:hypothetical protein